MAYNPYGYGGGGGAGGGSLEERRRALLEYLSGRGQGQAGFNGLQGLGRASAVGRMGGLGGTAPSSGLTYNPFLTQAYGRPAENFMSATGGTPQGVAQSALAAVQAGTQGVGGQIVQGPQGGVGPGSWAPPQAAQPQWTPPQPSGGVAGGGMIGVGTPAPEGMAQTPSPIQSNFNLAGMGPADPFLRNFRFGRNLAQ